MDSARRLSLIQSHLVKEFNFPHDPSLEEYRKRGVAFNKQDFFDAYFDIAAEIMRDLRQEYINEPLMRHALDYELPRDQARELALRRIVMIKQSHTSTHEEEWLDPHTTFAKSWGLISFDQGLSVRLGVHTNLYTDTLRNLGTAKHMPLIRRAFTLEDYGCFGLTELGHGSNVAAIDLTATYDHGSRTFVLNSPKPLAAKFWIGAAGKTANMGAVFAQLYMDGKSKGVHVFAVPLRDLSTHNPIPGVIIGDCGAKVGLIAIDNGFLLFKGYRVPYDSLLDRLSSITPEGKFKSNIKDPQKRFSAMLSGLIRGRQSCVINAEVNSRNALTVAIRYAAVRKQFSYGDGPERSILDYSLHRFRLMPHLANTFASNAACLMTEKMFGALRQRIYDQPDCSEGEELHAIMSAFKAICTAYARDSIQECREACGGLGYSEYAGLGRMRNSHDINLTWDGDNNVLIQQAAKYVLKVYQRIFKGQPLQAKSLNYLTADSASVNEAKATFTSKAQLRNNPEVYQDAFQHWVNLLLRQSVLKLQENVGTTSYVTEAWNMTQPLYLHELARAYGETTLLAEMVERARGVKCAVVSELLMRLTEVYALSKIYKNLGTFREGYLSTEQGHLVKDYLIDACNELGESAVKIIDAIASPDELLGSVLGTSDGQVYSNLMETVESAPGCYTRPEWISILQEFRQTLSSKP
jgi:acyl-CoA oxidase